MEIGTDASDTAGGAVINWGFGAAELKVIWSEWESLGSSNWHELCMSWWIMDLLGDDLSGKRVHLALDNMVVALCLGEGLANLHG